MIGNGLALPHAILESATRPVTLLATLETPVDFGSPDNMPVEVMALVLSADEDSNGYLSTVNAVSRILHQRHAQLCEFRSEADIRSALEEPQIVAALQRCRSSGQERPPSKLSETTHKKTHRQSDCFLNEVGGAKRDRTADLYNAIVALSQLSYSPPVVVSPRRFLRGATVYPSRIAPGK